MGPTMLNTCKSAAHEVALKSSEELEGQAYNFMQVFK
jgi:hypothetical protein